MNRMNRMGKAMLMYDQLVSAEEVIERIMAVNAEQINEFATETLQADNFLWQPLAQRKLWKPWRLSLNGGGVNGYEN